MAALAIHLLFNADSLCALSMDIFKSIIALAMLTNFLTTSVQAERPRRGDQDAAYQGTVQGTILSLRSIENNVIPRMRARGSDYIGTEFDRELARYRLKFIHDGAVIWIDVDGRNGTIIGTAGE
jgi:hypothetical protein